jgi:hypothetical protein
MAVAFLYECINKGVSIHLITKHNGNLYETLSKYRLNHLFDSVENVSSSDSKSNHVTCKPAIFIDDSFKERRDVNMNLKIPVFSPDAIDSLMNS